MTDPGINQRASRCFCFYRAADDDAARDEGFVIYFDPGTHALDFYVYMVGSCMGADSLLDESKPHSERIPDDVRPFLSGHVKWDGCVNYAPSRVEPGCMDHACTLHELLVYERAFRKLYELAAIHIPAWSID